MKYIGGVAPARNRLIAGQNMDELLVKLGEMIMCSFVEMIRNVELRRPIHPVCSWSLIEFECAHLEAKKILTGASR